MQNVASQTDATNGNATASPVKIKWSQSGNNFSLDHGSTTTDVLPMGVYNIQASKQGLFLERRPTGFVLPERLYGLEQSFIDRVLVTFERTKGNLGILLNGIRGTGKTVTAEIVAQQLRMPIILICQDFPGIIDFMDSIPHSVTFLCDEFEKVFVHNPEMLGGGQQERGASKLLPLMDGVMNSTHRKAFILTTNSLRVEENLLQRPGRIRYLKTFGNLSRDGIEMIVDDQLENRELREAVVEYIARLELITIDIVTTLIAEVNIHGGPIDALEGVFNVKTLEHVFEIRRVDRETMEEGATQYNCTVSPFPITDKNVQNRDDLYINRNDSGEIIAVKGEYITLNRYNHTKDEKEEVLIRLIARRAYNSESFGKDYVSKAV